jgi:prepilin-type N-terminal cleavage/methylation domain-containing protein
MKKKLKAFTLIELIIVMALLSVLTLGIMRLFTPVRQAYQNATVYETKRQVCTSINKYLTESVRYAYFVGAYDVTAASNSTAAAQKLFDDIAADTSHSHTITDAEYKKLGEAIQVIEINYNLFYNNENGRLFRYKEFKFNGTGAAGLIGSAKSDHLVFGNEFYANNSFTIRALYKNGTFAVSAATDGLGNQMDGPDGYYTNNGGTVPIPGNVVVVSGGVVMNNINNTGVGGKLYGKDSFAYSGGTEDFNYLDASKTSGVDGIPDILQGNGTINSSGSSRYYIAYINAQDIPW